MAYDGLPQGAVVDEQPRYVGLPPGATVNVPPRGPQTIGGGAQLSFPTPVQDVPIVPEGPVPELRAAPSQTAINVHNVAHETLPWVGLGLGEAAAAPVTAGGGLLTAGASVPVTVAAAGATGFAAGRKAAEGVDALTGFRSLNPPQSGLEAAQRTVGDVGEGAFYAMTGQSLAAGAGMLGQKIAARAKPDFALNKVVRKGIEKGVRPSVVGKRTWAQRVKSTKRAGEAVRAIIKNKQLLSFTDDAGNAVSGRLPRNLNEFSQAIDQTKRTIFGAYDELAVTAGTKGAQVNLVPIADELGRVAGGKALQDQAPEAVSYALSMADRLAKRGALTPLELQEQLVLINKRLDSFYTKGVGTVNQAYVDTIMADKMRLGLDDAIEGAAGAGYQALKNQYGALKSIEREVNHRAVVAGRQNIRSLTDFISDMAAIGHTVQAAAKAEPGGIIAGAAVKAGAKLHKLRNDPNRIITKMFENAEKIITKGEAPSAFAATAGRIGASRGVPKVVPPTVAEDPAAALRGLPRTPTKSAAESAATFRAYPPQSPAAETTLAGPLGQGHRPINIPEPQLPVPKSAAESARVFEAMPSQTPAADRAGAFVGPREMIRRSPAGQSAAAFEKVSMANKTPQAMDAIKARLTGAQSRGAVEGLGGGGGLSRAGRGKPNIAIAPKWVKKEVRAMLPADTPEWLVTEYVNAAMGRR